MTAPSSPAPTITLRIPGNWAHPGELVERLPEGFSLSPEALRLPDGTAVEFIPLPPDRQFPRIFESSCSRPPQQAERDAIARYTVNVGLVGPGGSLEAARKMLRAGAAIVRAGGAGVFVDNSLRAHGGRDWVAMADDGGADAIRYAFVALIRGPEDAYTMGLRALGLADLLLPSADADPDGETLTDLLRAVCGSNRPLEVGHLLANGRGVHFRVVARTADGFDADSPAHNPYGRWKLVNAKDLADSN